MMISFPFNLPLYSINEAESFNAITIKFPFFNPLVPAVQVFGQASKGL